MLIIFCGLYLFPSFVAGIRGHHNVVSIVVINIFLGWTFVGWVIALAMACSHVNKNVTQESRSNF